MDGEGGFMVQFHKCTVYIHKVLKAIGRQNAIGLIVYGDVPTSVWKHPYNLVLLRYSLGHKFKIALCQLSVSADKERNIAYARQVIEEAAGKGAQLILFPEIWNSPYSNDSFPVYAEDIDSGESPSTAMLAELSRDLKITIVGGSIPERSGDRLYNTCCVFGTDGKLKAKHRKIHLFDIDIPGKMTFKESKTLTAGETPTIVDTDFNNSLLHADVGRIGIGICYDIRFQELAAIYAGRGAHLLCYPGAFNMTTGPLHWELLQRARAADCQLYVATCSPARDSDSSYVAWGHSTLVGPFGEVLATTEHDEAIVISDIDYSLIDQRRQTLKQRRKMPSFSSSLLDAIYHSIDEPNEQQQQHVQDFVIHRRKNNASQVEEEIESLRRAIMVEKWMENYSSTTTTTPRHLPSNSGSSTDSSLFSSSETDSSASRSTPKLFQKSKISQKPSTDRPGKIFQGENTPKPEGPFTRTKSRAMKIYGDLKKVKEPISPGGKIANFLNFIFSPRNLKKNQGLEEWNSSVRKSRSMKDTNTCSLASRSCLSKNSSSRGNKSKRSVRFCPVSVIVDEDSQPCGQKSLYDDQYLVSSSMPIIGSQYIKKNIDSFRVYEGKNARKHEFREFYENESDLDDKSCASSDLFELENIGRVGIGAYEEELPVYGTTSLKMNQAIASGLFM
ncbi:hypothetical protein BUALT_Bualt09G0038000 [Buddleja alternifolia]|uniref:CN hydrolase domain-containing protein n=1 Tax=Buddleja alternifolia TaxID=168488 RepID=A0AAV6WZ23_9LAMI|nr:hypothetical protein BUALT_Bualt09G0038000 [Buddleja alternifolia]